MVPRCFVWIEYVFLYRHGASNDAATLNFSQMRSQRKLGSCFYSSIEIS